MDRRLFDFFNDKFEEKLPGSRTMQGAFDAARTEIEKDLRFTPYSNFESFNATRKKKKKARR
jgi:hypothetical protein